MSEQTIFEQIKLALADAPRNQYTAELHLQMIKYADELKHITSKEFSTKEDSRQKHLILC